MSKLSLVFMVVLVAGCTDASISAFSALGNEAEITCYSGSQVVFRDTSTGKIMSGDGGNGLFFNSKTTGKYIRAYADCIVISK